MCLSFDVVGTPCLVIFLSCESGLLYVACGCVLFMLVKIFLLRFMECVSARRDWT